ncbi:MAG TPA: lamin tail domain-containing protein [Sedimentisphaerales bacterium]|nr:lamin tail domain-containing protein [Sedimentisphaerales bacterium]
MDGVNRQSSRPGVLLFCVLMMSPACWADSVIVFNEIMYHPADGAPEWVELYNQMGIDIDMSGWALEGGVDYTFADGTILRAGSCLVVAADPTSVQTRTGAPVLGPFTGKLANDGETLRLVTNSGRLLNRVKYETEGDWPVAPDGSGVSLARINPMRGVEDAGNWTWSNQVGGTPGAENFPGAIVADRSLRFNEIDAPGGNSFRIELVYTGSDSVSLQDYSLEIRGEVDLLWTLPAVSLQPGATYVISNANFGVICVAGDRLFLRQGDTAVSDATIVAKSARGRYPDGADAWYNLQSTTFGASNHVDLCEDIVINEIMYNPMTLPVSDASPDTTTDMVTLVAEVASARTLIPQDASVGYAWTGGAEPFDDSSWTSGTTGVGYERGTGYESYIGTNTAAMYGTQASVFTRIKFNVVDPTQLESVTLSVRYDDGFVAWLNGVEIARINAPDALAWNSSATTSHDDVYAEIFQAFDVSTSVGLLKAGSNILAIQGLNNSTTSSDFLIQPKLEAAVKAQETETDPDAGKPYSAADSPTWIELYNKGSEWIDLSGWSLTQGIGFVIPDGTVLEPDGYLVIAQDAKYLAAKYPDVEIVGDFSGKLSNSGETIVLADAQGNPVDRVRYYDGGSWPSYADGGGCSLELKDPRADNNVGSAWAASDESSRTAWKDFSYRGTATGSPVGNDDLYKEFVMGLLYDGEILIDDLRVIEDPDGATVDLLQNGDFSSGTSAWRIIGNHRHSQVEPDPEDASNRVLRLVATGPTEHMHNHAETTFANGRSVVNGRQYEIRFRARWVAGSPLLNTRLFFNRLPVTTVLPVPEQTGTPGRRNSRWQANIGPTCSGLHHEPAIPSIRGRALVTVQAHDPDGIALMTLWYRKDGASWYAVAMEATEEGYQGWIPIHSAGTLVQFYVEAIDSRGDLSWCPAAGPESFAQYRVEDGKPRTTGVHNYRIVMRNAEKNFLYASTNLMSNEGVGATLIYNERESYYDVGVHIKSSEHGRPKTGRVGFTIFLSPEYPFRGVHDKISFDRSNGQEVGQQEMLLHTAMNRYGGFSKYHDLGYVIAPDDAHTSGVEVQMARYDRLYCEEMYGDDGGDGTLFEYELVYSLTATVGNSPEGLKIPQEGGGVYGLDVANYLGDDKEKYRYHFLIKNNRALDNYAPIMQMTNVLALSGSAFTQTVDQYIDVEEWLRAFAIGSTCGVSDNWISGSAHNALFYHRPTDNRMLFFLHDLDYYNGGVSLKSNSILNKLTSATAWNRVFYGNVYDFLAVSFNRDYMAYWTAHYATLLPEQPWSSWLNYINSRHANAMSQVLAAMPAQVAFSVLTSVDGALTGRGWINVREIRHMETDTVLDVVWRDSTTWAATLPAGVTSGTLNAYDSAGRLVGVALIP